MNLATGTMKCRQAFKAKVCTDELIRNSKRIFHGTDLLTDISLV